MILDWKNWCKLCGNVTLTTNNDYSTDVNNIFKISSYKVCLNCDDYLRGFQSFLVKSRNVDKLFKSLSKENKLYLDEERINELRVKYELDPLDIKEEDPSLVFLPDLLKEDKKTSISLFNENIDIKLESKEDPDNDSDHNFEVDLAIHDNLFSQFSPEPDPVPDQVTSKRRPPIRKKKRKTNFSEDDEESDNSRDPDYIVEEESPKSRKSKTRKEKTVQAEKKEKSKTDTVFPLICHICEEDFKTKGITALINHCKQVHDCKPEITCICGKLVASTAQIYKHKRKCLNDYSNAAYECDICGTRRTAKYFINYHMEMFHKIESKESKTCKVCSRQFKTGSSYRKHLKTQHIPEEERIRIPCPFDFCGVSFISKNTLNTHIKLKHQAKKDFICHICSSGFLTNCKLEAHLLSHEKNSFNFVCDICQAKFQTPYNLKVHKRTHGPVQFFCAHCNKGFKTKNVLRNHVKNIHLSTGERNFKCLQCAAAYKNRPGLRNHMLTHNDYNLPCFWCSSIFKKPTIRTEHHKKYHPAEFAEYRKLNPPKNGRSSNYQCMVDSVKN